MGMGQADGHGPGQLGCEQNSDSVNQHDSVGELLDMDGQLESAVGNEAGEAPNASTEGSRCNASR